MTKSPSDDRENTLHNMIFDLVNRAQVHRSCLSCMSFDEPTETCDRANGARPPARTIAMGCPLWIEPVPF